MALNLLGSGFGNQNYTPVNPNAQGPLTNIISKYGKDSITRTRTTTSPGKPVTRTVTRTVAQPEMEYAKYQGPEEETARIPTKAVFGTTPKQRQTYVREVEDYNKQIRAEKQKVIDYNKEVEQWNKSGRFTKVTRTYTETPTVTKTTTTTIPLSKPTVTTTTTKPIVTTKTLTSKERLDAISKPKDYLKDFADRKAEAEKPTLFTAIGREAYASPLFGTIAKMFESVYKESKLIGAGMPTKPDVSKHPLIRANRIINEESAKLRERANLKTFLEYDKAISPTIQNLRSSLISPPTADVRGDIKKLQDTRVYKALSLDNPQLTQEKAKAIAKAGLEKAKDTEFQAKAIVFTGELALPYVLSRGPQIFTSARYRLFGTRVAPETLYSPIAMKSPRGLDLTYNPEKTIKALKKTYGKTAELPNQYVAVSQTRSTDLGKKVLTRAELAAKGIKQGSEPGLFISAKGAGQTGFLGISDDVGYKLTLDPRKIFNQGQPTTFQIGFKQFGQYPKSILNAPLNQAQLEAYQISQAPKSKALITRMSSLGTKFEPELILPVTSKLSKVKTPLYFTEVKGTVVPIKTVSVLGTGDTAKNLISGKSVFKGTQAYESLKASSSRYIPVNPFAFLSLSSKSSDSKYKSSLSSSSDSKYKSSLSSLFSTSKISTVSKIEDDEPIIPRPSPTYKSETSISKILSRTTSTSSPLPAPTYTSRTPSRPSLTTNYRTRTGSRILRPVIPKDRKQKEQISGEPAYDVLIKVGNKWVNKTNGKRNIYSAMHRGADIVDNTVAKSFKIKKGTGRANIFKYNAPYNINKFYTPSKTRSAKLTGAYIEKNKFAIDTPGERRGLSVAKYLRGVKLI